MTNWITPTRVHTAYNPALFRAQTGNQDIETISLSVTSLNSDHDAVQLSAETYKGEAMFDMSAVVQSWLADRLAETGDAPVEDPALFVRYSAGALGQFLALNAVSQVGETTDKGEWAGKVLTRFARLRKYEGYPLDYSLLAGDNGIDTPAGLTGNHGVYRVPVLEATQNLQDREGENIQDEDSEDIMLRQQHEIKIFDTCVPDRPFYIRWINMLGGVDYFMFSTQQKRSDSVKSSSTYTPYMRDTAKVADNLRTYALATESTVTVGAEGLCASDYAALREMPFSPHIELYDKEHDTWLRISVSKYDGTQYTKPETRSFEVTFALPKINTQF